VLNRSRFRGVHASVAGGIVTVLVAAPDGTRRDRCRGGSPSGPRPRNATQMEDSNEPTFLATTEACNRASSSQGLATASRVLNVPGQSRVPTPDRRPLPWWWSFPAHPPPSTTCIHPIRRVPCRASARTSRNDKRARRQGHPGAIVGPGPEAGWSPRAVRGIPRHGVPGSRRTPEPLCEASGHALGPGRAVCEEALPTPPTAPR